MRKTCDSWKRAAMVVERARRGQVVAERLLADDPRALVQPGRPQHLDDRRERGGRDREVEEPAGLPADRALRGLHGRHEPRGVVGVRGAEGEACREGVPARPHRGGPTRSGDRVTSEVAERLGGHGERLGRGPDDPDPLREEARLVEVEEARQDLAPREVPGRAEEHEHVVVRAARAHGHGAHGPPRGGSAAVSSAAASPCPTRTEATRAGSKSPCSTTPGAAERRAARAAGSSVGPR